MFRTGIQGMDWISRSFRLSVCLMAGVVMLAGIGCVGTRVAQKNRIVKPVAPEAIVADAVTRASDSEPGDEAASEVVSNSGGVGSPPGEVALQVTSEGAEVAQILKQTRGAVFASLNAPVGAGPPASTVRLDGESDEAGSQDSVASQTGEDSADESAAIPTSLTGGAEAAEPVADAPPAPAVPEEPAEVEVAAAITEESAEAEIAEAIPDPPAEAPAEEGADNSTAEVARVESPPEAIVPPVTQEASGETLTSNNLAPAPVGGSRSNTTSIFFLVLGGIGAALILIRRRAAV